MGSTVNVGFGRAQRQSDLEKKGEGEAHKQGVARMVKVLRNRKWYVYPSYPLWVGWQSGFENKTKDKEDYFYQEFDIFAKRKYANGLTSLLIVEVDGKVHNSVEQQRRDKKVQLFAEFFINDVIFKRIKLGKILHKTTTDEELYSGELKLH